MIKGRNRVAVLKYVMLVVLLVNSKSIVVVVVGNSSVDTNRYKSCDEICEVGRCYYKGCEKSIDCSGGLCTFWSSKVSTR